MTTTRGARGWFSSLPLFWQIFLPNLLVLVAATTLLVLSPASVPSTAAQAFELIGAVALVALINLFLTWRTVTPLRRLTALIGRVDPLEPGQRAPAVGGSAEVAVLADAFNEMLDRLETERRESGAKMLAAQERERIRLSRELHDEIGQSITGLMLELDAVAGGAPGALAPRLLETKEMARDIGDEVREIVRRLRPEALDDLGLQSAIVALTERFAEQNSTVVSRRIEWDLPTLSEEAELVLYRVAQESLTNVVRHARASTVEVELSRHDEEVVLRVADDGEPVGGLHPRSGIEGMRERTMLIDGRLTIDAKPAGGVEVTLAVPAKDGR